MAYSVAIAPLVAEAFIGGLPTTFTATPTGAAVEGVDSFVWTVDGVPQASVIATMEYIAEAPAGEKTIKVVATTTPTDEGEPETAEATATLTAEVAPPPLPDGDLPYVHPLPQRTSAYIWCGWWVMDEIQKMTLEGKDWKTEDPDSDYYLHRYTLAQMIVDYPEVDVQESRNGYIIHKSALEAGIIYTYP